MRRTKIVATIGPATRERAMLANLIAAGVDVVRLNFSHGTRAEHGEVVERVREMAGANGRAVAILQDLSGPKIRTGRLAGGNPVELRTGARILVTTDESIEGTAERISTTYGPLPRDVRPGDRVLLDDGNLELQVVSSSGDDVECTVVHGGWLSPNKGMNFPGVALSAAALTPKDREDLAFGVTAGVDYVALSFVRSAADLIETKRLIASLGGTTPVIAKIEKREAIEALDAILDVADGVMVARGDLGVELSTEEVPALQKRIIEKASNVGKVVITATQMLESMVDNPRPTRAEASDVANAILDGTDAVMLSAETAIGRYPAECVETMARIASYTEEHLGFRAPSRLAIRGSETACSLARAAAAVAEELGCRLIVAFTESGMTARLVSSYQPRAVIAGITPREPTFRRLALWWGVTPLLTTESETTDEMMANGEEQLRAAGLARSGDTVVMLSGQSRTVGATNTLHVATIA